MTIMRFISFGTNVDKSLQAACGCQSSCWQCGVGCCICCCVTYVSTL